MSSGDSIKSFGGQLLPSSEVIIFYGGVSTIVAFIGVLIYYAFVRRNPLNIDTFVKHNNYAVINKRTVAAFCTTAVLTVAYYAIYKPMQTQSQPAPAAAASSGYDPAFKITMLAFFACVAYVLYQTYSMLNWSITATPREVRT